MKREETDKVYTLYTAEGELTMTPFLFHKAVNEILENLTSKQLLGVDLKELPDSHNFCDPNDWTGNSAVEHKQVIRDLLQMYILNLDENGYTKATLAEMMELSDRAAKLIVLK